MLSTCTDFKSIEDTVDTDEMANFEELLNTSLVEEEEALHRIEGCQQHTGPRSHRHHNESPTSLT